MPARRTGSSVSWQAPLVSTQSILSLRGRGLLRCARNDGEGGWSASCQRFVEVLPRHCEERSERSNPCFLFAAAWIASLAPAMTGREHYPAPARGSAPSPSDIETRQRRRSP